MLFSMNQKSEILDTIQTLGNLGKLRQKIVNGQPSISYSGCDLQSDDRPNYVRQGSNELMLDKQISDLRLQAPDHDKIMGQRHDPYEPETVQNKYLKILT